MTIEAMIKVLRYKSEHIKTRIKPEFFSEVADVLEKEPKTGHWIKITPSGIYMCSECEQNVLTGDIDAYHYCHHCGIKMVEPQESEDKE